MFPWSRPASDVALLVVAVSRGGRFCSASGAEDTGGAAVVDVLYESLDPDPPEAGTSQLSLEGCELSFNKAETGPALATLHLTDSLTTLTMSSNVFVDNTYLCVGKEFLQGYTNVR